MDAGQVGEESKAGAELGLANLADGGSGVIDELIGELVSEVDKRVVIEEIRVPGEAF